jgi:hypothetical protein
VVDNLVERSAGGVLDRLERPVRWIAEAKEPGETPVVGKPQDIGGEPVVVD